MVAVCYYWYMKDLVPIRDAAAEFGVSRMTLHRYVRQGRITSYRKGLDRRTFVDRVELRKISEPVAQKRS